MYKQWLISKQYLSSQLEVNTEHWFNLKLGRLLEDKMGKGQEGV